MADRNDNYVACDLETSGFDFETGLIFEVAFVIAGPDYKEKARFQSLVSHPLPDVRAKMSPEVAEMHRKSGLLRLMFTPWLTDPSRMNPMTAGFPLPVLDFQVAKFITDAGSDGGTLLGSSAHFDKDWLRRHMPLTFRRLHYRICDVSSVKEQLRRKGWALETSQKSVHRALPDCLYSLRLAQFYDEHCFKDPPTDQLLIPQPEDIPEAKEVLSQPPPAAQEGPKEGTRVEVVKDASPGYQDAASTTKISTGRPGETKVSILYEDHQKAPVARGGTRVVVEEPPTIIETPPEPLSVAPDVHLSAPPPVADEETE